MSRQNHRRLQRAGTSRHVARRRARTSSGEQPGEEPPGGDPGCPAAALVPGDPGSSAGGPWSTRRVVDVAGDERPPLVLLGPVPPQPSGSPFAPEEPPTTATTRSASVERPASACSSPTASAVPNTQESRCQFGWPPSGVANTGISPPLSWPPATAPSAVSPAVDQSSTRERQESGPRDDAGSSSETHGTARAVTYAVDDEQRQGPALTSTTEAHRRTATFQDHRLERRFRSDGFVVVDLAPPEHLAPLLEVYARHASGIDAGYYPSLMSRDAGYKAAVDADLEPVLWPLLAAVLVDYEALVSAFMVKHPGPDTEVSPHQDWNTVDEPEVGATLNCWFPLTPITRRTGKMAVLPGSHRWIEGLQGESDLPHAVPRRSANACGRSSWRRWTSRSGRRWCTTAACCTAPHPTATRPPGWSPTSTPSRPAPCTTSGRPTAPSRATGSATVLHQLLHRRSSRRGAVLQDADYRCPSLTFDEFAERHRRNRPRRLARRAPPAGQAASQPGLVIGSGGQLEPLHRDGMRHVAVAVPEIEEEGWLHQPVIDHTPPGFASFDLGVEAGLRVSGTRTSWMASRSSLARLGAE